MARNLENSTSDNSNNQEMGPRRSTRLDVVLGGTAPPPRGSTMAPTMVTTRDKVHGTTTMAQIVSPRQAQAIPHKVYAAKATAQASHSRASHTEQPAPVTKPAPAAQPAPTAQPAPMVSQAAQDGSRPFQLSGPIVEPGVISQPFFTDLTFTNSNLVPGINHLSTAQGGIFLPSSSNLSGDLSRQVLQLTNALAQQTTLVNRFLQRTEIQHAPDEVSQSRTRVNKEPYQQRPGKQPINQTEQSGGVQSRSGPRDSVNSRLSARRSAHSRLGPRASIQSRLGPRFDEPHEQPSRQNIHSRLGPQGVSSMSLRRMQRDVRREAVTRSASSSTGSLRKDPTPARQPRQQQVEHPEEQPRPVGQDLGQPRAPLPQQKQIQEEVERLFNERLREFQRNKVADETLRRDMTNISRSPFTDEIEQAEPPRKFSMPHFTFFKGDGDPERHLKHYRSAMVLYRNNDAFMCKIFATTLQGEAQDWFHTLPQQSIQNFDDLSLVFTKEYSSYRSIKKKSDHLFNVKKNPKKSLRDYVKRFKAEKAKIIGCDDSIASAAFQKGLQQIILYLER